MFNIIVRATRICWPLGQAAQGSRHVQRLPYSSFTVRDILSETSDEAGTLINRFAKHIAMEAHKCTPLVGTTIRYPEFFPVTDMRHFQQELRRTSGEQLPFLFIYAYTYRSNADPVKFAHVLNDLDAAAVHLLAKMSEDTVLRTLYAMLFLLPNWITRTDFYRAAVVRLAERDFTADTAMEKFVQLCFYLGLDKKHMAAKSTGPLLKQLLEQHLEQHLPQLSTMDLAIVCNAAYKTSTSVQSAAYGQRLENEVLALPMDGTQDALLVTFLKAMRFQRVRSEKVCEHLANICSSPSALQQLQGRGIVHLFAYLAENLWDRSDCTEPLIKEFLSRLGNSNQKFHAQGEAALRTKDVAMFLWCCAQLNCTLPTADLQRIETILLQKVRNNEFRYFSDQLVDSCMSLWTLGHQSRELLQEAIAAKSYTRPNNNNRQQREQPKVDSRLSVLLTAAAIEQPKWSTKVSLPFNLDESVPAYLLKSRADLVKYANLWSTEEGVESVKLVCPINAINIPGILVHFNVAPSSDEAAVFVELLSESQALRFSGEPVSIVRLKIRLLSALGHKVVVLRPGELENDTCLKDLVFSDDQPEEQSIGSI